MTIHSHTVRFFHHHPIAQVMTVFGFWLLGEGVVRLIGMSLPGGIVGMAVLLILLLMRRVSAVSIRRGAGWFLSDMLLFFVPAVLALMDHPELIGLTGLKVLFVILTSTTLVMIATVFTVDLCGKYLVRMSETNNV